MLMLLTALAMQGSTTPATVTPADDEAEKLYDEGKALYDAKNYTAALPKLRAAANMGHKKAQYRIGRCYDKGHGVEEDNDEAVKWYLKSANQGYYKAEYQMARAYIKGKSVTASSKKAKEWVKKAIGGKKHGAEMLQKIKDEAAAGDKTDIKLLKLISE